MVVRQLPPNESSRSRVSLESRYGTWDRARRSVNAEITLPWVRPWIVFTPAVQWFTNFSKLQRSLCFWLKKTYLTFNYQSVMLLDSSKFWRSVWHWCCKKSEMTKNKITKESLPLAQLVAILCVECLIYNFVQTWKYLCASCSTALASTLYIPYTLNICKFNVIRFSTYCCQHNFQNLSIKPISTNQVLFTPATSSNTKKWSKDA